MELPPGPSYLLRLLPYYAVPSITTYLGLRLLQEYQPKLYVPMWLVVLLTTSARPVYGILSLYWADLMNKRAAAANGAVLAPVIQESTISVLPRLGETTRNGYPNEMMLYWSKIYGNVYQLSPRPLPSMFVTLEPEHIKAILATQFQSFEKGPTFISQMSSLLGTGVFNSDGKMWKFHRSITRPFFTRERISDFEIYERNCDFALAQGRERLADGISIDFQDLSARFTLDSAAEFLFGGTVNSISAGIPYPPSSSLRNPQSFYDHPSTAFVNSFGASQVLSVVRLGYGPAWPLLEFMGDKVKPLRKVVDTFIEPLMQNALDKREKESETGDKKNEEDSNVLAHLVRQTQDPKIIKDELFNLLVAGRDTTSALLTFSLYMLTQHPDIETRLREEIFKIVGTMESPTYLHMREMKYMRAFLNEVLRLYPPVPADSRTTNEAVVLPATQTGIKPIYIPANTTCIYNIMNMQRRTDLWGPDALQFDPDRFLDERLHKYLVPNPFIFCPFNAGPRICLGQQFAYHEATFFLVRLLQQFTGFTLDDSINAQPPAEWALAEGLKATEKIHPLAHLTMYVKGGLWVKMDEFKGT